MDRQLNLFRSSRQRGTVAYGPSEFQLHCMVADTLRIGLAPGWAWFHPANGEAREAGTGARLKRMGVKPGVSDLILYRKPGAQLHALELKKRGEKPSEAQWAYLNEVVDLGGKAAWADTVSGALDILKGWGALRSGVHI